MTLKETMAIIDKYEFKSVLTGDEEFLLLEALDFMIETTTLDIDYEILKAEGVNFISEPVTIDVGGGKCWKYAYFFDLDGNYVALMEQRF